MLIDAATLLAELARPGLLSGDPTYGQLMQAFNQLQHRPPRASIGGINRMRSEYHAYMTDTQGKVLFDSANKAVGQDYSRWNDVWLTLRGQYDARSTSQNPVDSESPVMCVATPIMDDPRLTDVLNVDKPNAAMALVIRHSERRILWANAILLEIALMIGAGMIWRISRSIVRLVCYVDSATDSRLVPLPDLGSNELCRLAQTLESACVKLEGKNYIERCAYALAHGLKGPLATIRGATEILREGPPSEAVVRFTDNILMQNVRMQALVETLLRQARLENRQEIVLTTTDVVALFHRVSETCTVQLAGKRITLHVTPTETNVATEPTLLEQALGNLLDNAIGFASESGYIALNAEMDQEHVTLKVLDTGDGVPDYAFSRTFERFHSLPHANGQGSSGLGLAFASEIARLFNGEVTLRSVQEDGVLALLRLHRHFIQLQILPTQSSYPATTTKEKTILKSPLFWKMVSLFGIVLLLLTPIMPIRQVAVERTNYRNDVEDAIRRNISGSQKLVGPLTATPMTELYTVQEEDKIVEWKRSFVHFWLPESLMADGNQNVEERKVRIYTGQIWHSDLTLKVDFDALRPSEFSTPNITLDKPFIVISVGDACGTSVVKAPKVGGTALTIEPSTGLE